MTEIIAEIGWNHMGNMELAKEMIKLTGKEIKDKENPSGDIEIIFTGLRAGEKLYEELLIGKNVSKTSHEHIMSANEESLSHEVVLNFIKKFKELNVDSEIQDIQKILYDSVSGYEPYKADNVVKLNK